MQNYNVDITPEIKTLIDIMPQTKTLVDSLFDPSPHTSQICVMDRLLYMLGVKMSDLQRTQDPNHSIELYTLCYLNDAFRCIAGTVRGHALARFEATLPKQKEEIA